MCFFFQAEDGIRDRLVTGVQTCALPILPYTVMTRENTNSLLDDMGLDPKVCAAEANCEVEDRKSVV